MLEDRDQHCLPSWPVAVERADIGRWAGPPSLLGMLGAVAAGLDESGVVGGDSELEPVA